MPKAKGRSVSVDRRCGVSAWLGYSVSYSIVLVLLLVIDLMMAGEKGTEKSENDNEHDWGANPVRGSGFHPESDEALSIASP
jgi:hypothetical protein